MSDHDDIVWLLQLASDAGSSSPTTLVDRRRLVLESIGKRIDADAGWWAWGQGHPHRSAVTPLALIHFGFTPEQLAIHIEAGLHPEMNTLHREPVLEFLKHAPQHTACGQDVIDDARWYKSDIYQKFGVKSGFDRFVHSVRYFEKDFWSNCVFHRKVGRPPFGKRECELLDCAMAGIKCMHISPVEALPPEKLAALTPRQRMVMLMLLDGKSRKQVASALHITAATVNDHAKAVFTLLGVGSITELAAMFLQGL